MIYFEDSTGQTRDVFVRYVREHAVENNEWGDFQTHRRLLGLITVGKFESQGELNEVNSTFLGKNVQLFLEKPQNSEIL